MYIYFRTVSDKTLEAIIEEIIERYFSLDKDPLLLGYMRYYPAIIDTLKEKHQKETDEAYFDLLSEPSVYYDAGNLEIQYLREQEAIGIVPIDIDEFVRNVRKFTIALQIEVLYNVQITDEQKRIVYNNQITALKRMVIIENDEGLSDFLENRFEFLEHEIALLEDKISRKSPTTSPKDSHVIWQADANTLKLLLDAMKLRGIINRKTPLENIFNGGKDILLIENGKLEIFVWLLHKLHENDCYRISGAKGHFNHFEKLLDWDYCNRPTKVPLRKILHKVKSIQSTPNPILTVVSAILKDSHIKEVK